MSLAAHLQELSESVTMLETLFQRQLQLMDQQLRVTSEQLELLGRQGGDLAALEMPPPPQAESPKTDRKSTRLNSSH